MLGPQNPLPSRERLGSALWAAGSAAVLPKSGVWASWSLSVPGNWLARLTFPWTGSRSRHPQNGLLGPLPDSLPRGRTEALLSRWANTSERVTHLFKVTQQVGLVAGSSCSASHNTHFPSLLAPQTPRAWTPFLLRWVQGRSELVRSSAPWWVQSCLLPRQQAGAEAPVIQNSAPPASG